jgi:hypothetical protein
MSLVDPNRQRTDLEQKKGEQQRKQNGFVAHAPDARQIAAKHGGGGARTTPQPPAGEAWKSLRPGFSVATQGPERCTTSFAPD